MHDTRRKIWTTGVMLLGLVGAALMAVWLPACSNNSAGYRALYVVRTVGGKADKTLASECRKKRLHCTSKFGHVRTPELEECLRRCHKALDSWVKIAKPAINTALRATYAGLETARAKRKTADWAKLLKPGFCALSGALGDWRHWLVDTLGNLVKTLETVGKVVCK